MQSITTELYPYGDSRLSPEFWQILEPPREIQVQGKPESMELLTRLPSRGLAVVGTRHPQARSLNEVRRVIAQLAGSDLIIVSGFARGIDAAAHQAALEFGLPTVAVLGCGLDIHYPVQHEQLRREILEAGGLLISEFPMGTEALPSSFLKRNRLIAGWTDATWVVEASYRSGALNTAKWARDQHKPVYATPCFPGDPALAGNQELLDRENAEPLWGRFTLGDTWIHLCTPAAWTSTRPPATLRVVQADGSMRDLSNSKTVPLAGGGILQVGLAPNSRDTQDLARLLKGICSRRGGATLQDALDATLASGWSPARFFAAFDDAQNRNLIRSKNGIIQTISPH